MKLVKDYLSLYYPETQFYCSNANEDDTEVDINTLGMRLSSEVR